MRRRLLTSGSRPFWDSWSSMDIGAAIIGGGVVGRARANRVPGVTMSRGRDRLQELEPAVRCVAALYSATTGVVDQLELMSSYASAIEERGGWIALKHEVTTIERVAGGFAIT